MSLIYSYINYCDVVWGAAYKNHLTLLVVLQKKAVRIINKSSYDAESAPIFHSLRLLDISKVHKLNCLKFMYNCLINNKLPEFGNKILENEFSHDYNTRNRGQLNPPFERLDTHWLKNGYILQNFSAPYVTTSQTKQLLIKLV